MSLWPSNVRYRLTLWYVSVTGLLLLFFICGAISLQFWQLTRQMYHAEVQDIETAEGLLAFAPDGRLLLHEEYHNHPQSRLLLDRLMEVLSPAGEVLLRNDRLGGRNLDGLPFKDEGVSSYNERRVRLEDGTHVLLISHVHSIDGRPLLIRLAYSTEPLERRLLEFAALLFLALPLTLLFAGFAGYRMVHQALLPLGEMATNAEQITANRLDERLPIANPDDEFGHMARVLNALLQRLENSFVSLKQFTSDASHELRTPLASIRSVGEVGLQREHTAEEYRDIIGSMLEEVTRLTQMVDMLLMMARTDAGQFELRKSVFAPLDLIKETVNMLEVLAEEKEQVITIEGGDNCLVDADRMVLQRALVNIIGNAIKYSRIGGTIHGAVGFTGKSVKASVEISIEDSGTGIHPELREKVFERFFRSDESRSRDAGGTGLGLAIAKWAVETNGGTITLSQIKDGGSRFIIELPTALQKASTEQT